MTVAELIVRLIELTSEKIVVIEDADTNWLLNINEVTESENVITIKGSYSDEYVKE